MTYVHWERVIVLYILGPLHEKVFQWGIKWYHIRLPKLNVLAILVRKIPTFPPYNVKGILTCTIAFKK